MKKIFCILSVIFCIMLTGCTSSSYTTVMCVENRTASGYEMTYQKLNGTKNLSLTVPDGETYLLSGAITTSAGELTISVAKKADDSTVFTSEVFDKSGSFDTELASGTYIIKLSAEEHSGSIELEWVSLGGRQS
ncbi:MAG: hypothetical protein ACI4JF_07750 [Oscillospiraceae bacterium]